MKFIKMTIFAVLLAIGTSSCDKYLDVNTDPSNPQISEGFVLLPPILENMALGVQFDSRFIGKYVQNFGSALQTDNWDLHGYDAGSDNSGQLWRNQYWALGQNVSLMMDDATKKQKWDYLGASKAIRAWSWQTCTDYHGEMILKQAWLPNTYSFNYDSQEDIYAEVVRLANDALTDLNRTDGAVSKESLAKGDLVYKGDRTKWIKFVYGVLARNANHLSNKSSYNPAKVIEYVDKSLASNDDNFNVPFAGTASGNANFFGPLRGNLNNFRQTQFMVNVLNGTTLNGVIDPRLSIICSASPDGVYRGVTPGKGDPNNANGNTSRIPTLWGVQANAYSATSTLGKYIFTDKANQALITYSELQFIKAEAAFIKGDKALALSAYVNGISSHMDFAGVSAADKATYLASAAVAQNSASLTLSDIMLQKYISLAMQNSIELWTDLCRYHYSSSIYKGFTLPSALYADNGGKPAYRVRPRYNSEYVWNLASLAKLGGDKVDYHTYEQWFTKP